MDAELTKSFAFSASYRSGARSVGANYILFVTLPALDEFAEKEMEAVVQKELISKVHTRDLSENVDFLKGVEVSDSGLLRAFREKLEKPLAGRGLRRLALQRDARTVTTLIL